MIESVIALASLVAMVLAFVLSPSIARCPDRWHVGGIARDGTFVCWGPVAPNCGAAVGPYEHVKCPTIPSVPGRIVCSGGAVALVVDHRTVACQRVREP